MPCLAPEPWAKPPCQGTRWPAGHPRSTGKALRPRVRCLERGWELGEPRWGEGRLALWKFMGQVCECCMD